MRREPLLPCEYCGAETSGRGWITPISRDASRDIRTCHHRICKGKALGEQVRARNEPIDLAGFRR